jgi:serine protease Do
MFMNQIIKNGLLIAGIALLTVPATVSAQDTKVKDKEDKYKVKEDKYKTEKDNVKDNIQNITITRNGDSKEKMVIEINGDKVKINGKDPKDVADVHVNVNNIKGANVYRFNTANGQNWSYNFNADDHMSLFTEDDNRAMLGVVTEGNDKGAEIMSITKESAAEKAGLKKGDILLKIGDTKIESTDDVTEAIHSRKPGDKVNIIYLRVDKENKATAELGKWKGIKMNAIAAPKIEGFGGQWKEMSPTMEGPMVFDRNGAVMAMGRPRLGLSIQDTDDGVGVKVLDVDDDSPADKAGIKEDDIIVGVNDHEVTGTDDVTKAMREKDKSSFTFRVKRDGKTQNIEVKIPKKLKTADL